MLPAESTPGANLVAPMHSPSYGNWTSARSSVSTVSVPDTETAKAHGMRYVHIPIGYDGLDEHAEKSLAQLVRQTSGRIFIHCHHGKHRGPAAAAIACMAEGEFDGENALRFLKQAGTDPRYAGLFRSVARYKRPTASDRLPRLVEVAEVDPIAESMADLDRHFDDLKPDEKGAVSEEAALVVKEVFRELTRTLAKSGEANSRDDRFLKLLHTATKSADELHGALTTSSPQQLAKAYRRLAKQCVECHRAYRD